ncbi:MAG: hypothetical protein KDD44_12345 [Bdellovibrionales bacterium]|nr:hypothetical protein [Bdellovibrionales bacterium]
MELTAPVIPRRKAMADKVSDILSPPVLLVATLGILVGRDGSDYCLLAAVYFVVCSGVLPLLALWHLCRKGVANKHLDEPESRILAFGWALLGTILGVSGLLTWSGMPRLFVVFAIAYALVLAVLFLASAVWRYRRLRYGPAAQAWKISIHGGGVGMLAGVAAALYPSLPVIASGLMLCAVMVVARVVNENHSPLQVVSGALTAGGIHCAALMFYAAP